MHSFAEKRALLEMQQMIVSLGYSAEFVPMIRPMIMASGDLLLAYVRLPSIDSVRVVLLSSPRLDGLKEIIKTMVGAVGSGV